MMVSATLHRPVLWSSTRSRLLDIMRTLGTVSRVELVGATGLTPGTISNVVRDLLDENLVLEVGHARSRGGQPRRLLQLRAQAHYAVGVQMDRCTSSVVLTDFGGRLVAQRTLQGSGNTSPEEMLTLLSHEILDLLELEQIPLGRVLGVSLVTYGPQDRLNGKLMAPRPTPEWYGCPLAPSLSRLTGLPVLLENDATAAALGEQWLGDVEADTFGVIYMASGLGGGVIVDREVYRGGGSNTVELGHISVDASGAPCECGNRGCIETTYGTAAVVSRALSATRFGAHLNLTGKPGDTLEDFEKLSQAAIGGDPYAGSLLGEAAYGLGQAAVTLVNLFDLQTVVLAGPAFSVAGPLLRDGISKVLNQSAFSRELRPISVVLSSHGSLAAAVGGALQVLRTPAGAAANA
jgi:predicted NBD/HSP70 family sugar kinase